MSNTVPDIITWQEDPRNIIVLANRSQSNFILDLPTGRCRLDAGRRLRTLRSITSFAQVKELIEKGELVIEV
jgi:hypothetical protein